MMSLLRRALWWLRAARKDDEVREELQFHLEQEARERREAGLGDDEARSWAHRDLGNEARLREDARAVWTWRPLDELSQDVRYTLRTLLRHRAVSAFATLSLALGIGANTAIYSFMDAILLRSLPVPDPASLVVLHWESKPYEFRKANAFVMHSISGSVYPSASGGREARIFPLLAFERLQEVSAPAFASLFVLVPGGPMNVLIDHQAELVEAQYVSGGFFAGVAALPSAGRLIGEQDDRLGAAPVVVISDGYAQRRFGSASRAVGQPILINNHAFTIAGVTAREFYGVDPGAAPGLYLPLQLNALFDADAPKRNIDPNYYFAGIMGRLRSGVTPEQAQSLLERPFAQWVATTASNDVERANLPALQVREGAGGLDTLRRQYSKPLYLLLVMVALILAIACANTANLLLARAAARRREIALRLSIGAGRFRLVRQLLTESLVLAAAGGALGIAIAFAGARLLTVLLANGDDGFSVNADLNWHVLLVSLALSLSCGVAFGLVPAIQATRPALLPALKDAAGGVALMRRRGGWPRLKLQQGLVIAQITLLTVLLVGAGLFVRTLAKLQTVPLGFNAEQLLLFDVNAPQAGHPEADVARFYADLQQRMSAIPGVRAVTLSHASLIKAGRGHPVRVDGVPVEESRFLQIGPAFFATMEIPILQGRAIDGRDAAAALPVAVVSDLFARRAFGDRNPIGRRLSVAGSLGMELEVVGVAPTVQYGSIKRPIPPVIYVSFPQLPVKQLQQMTFALRTGGDPMRLASTVRQIVQAADARVPVTDLRTQQAEIDQTINQELVLARLATAFAVLALVIAGVGLYGTMAYAVTTRTREIGIRMALGARRTAVTWMVLREVCVLVVIALAISIPIARGTSRFVASFLFDMTPNDPRAIAAALVTLVVALLVAGYGPARRATRIDPTAALRDE